MIDMKTLDKYSKFINLYQVCELSEVNYPNVKNKLQRFKKNHKSRLKKHEAKKLTRGLKKLGIANPANFDIS